MSDDADPERLLAEALRAQARSAPADPARSVARDVPGMTDDGADGAGGAEDATAGKAPVGKPTVGKLTGGKPTHGKPPASPDAAGGVGDSHRSSLPVGAAGPGGAAGASGPEPAAPAEPNGSAVVTGEGAEVPASYGLLSGAEPGSLERERAALEATTPPAMAEPPPEAATVEQPARPAGGPLPVGWILLLAVLLGLAAGSVVGLLSLH
ncbi:hypothetical protein SAMN05421810_103387 [Amycolatopsis arida]|uniref:Uncharacterized protein n=1 Tax=Amycolatopsis arida TaxID=587909 RepID=A0A1I5T4W2_9PSEU|nr:hypothetical protein [Amycolatopsis arida]TDX96234.1 hypothetical protein CLV69_103371 [Amycolatopsis arida]SFP77881.1 hypothetical protein SAMN05421810_103387 [Amycolatopsis arida]